MDKQQAFKIVIATISELYDKQISPQGQKIWWNALKDYTAEQIGMALQEHISDPDEGRFAPKPANLVGKIIGTNKQAEVSVEASAIQAWESAYKAMMKLGQYQSVKLQDRLAMKVIEYMGGWPSFCLMKQSEEQWRRKEFIETYKTLHGSENLPERLGCVSQNALGNNAEVEASRLIDQMELGNG